MRLIGFLFMLFRVGHPIRFCIYGGFPKLGVLLRRRCCMKGCRKKWIHDFPSLKSIHDSRAASAELILQDRTKQNRSCEVCIYTSALGTATLLGELCRELYKTCSRLELYYLEPRSKRQQGHMPAQEGCISALLLRQTARA